MNAAVWITLATLGTVIATTGSVCFYMAFKVADAERHRWKRGFEVVERHRIEARDRHNTLNQRALKGGMEIGYKNGYKDGLEAGRKSIIAEVGERRIVSQPIHDPAQLTDRYLHYLIERSILQLWSDGYGVRGGIVLHRRPGFGFEPDRLELEFLVTPKVTLGNEGQQYTWRYQGEHVLGQVHHPSTPPQELTRDDT